MCNTWFPTATMGTRTHLSVTLYVHCLSCSPSHQMNSGFCCESNESSSRLRDRQPWILGSSPSKGTVFFLSSRATRPSAEPTQPLVQWAGNTLPLGRGKGGGAPGE